MRESRTYGSVRGGGEQAPSLPRPMPVSDCHGSNRRQTVPPVTWATRAARDPLRPTEATRRTSKNSTRLPDLENIALGIAAIADLGAFELPFSFDSIHGASQLCCPTSRACNVLSREYELDRCVLATLGRRCDLDRGRDTFGNPDDYQLRWLTTKDCKSLFDLLRIKASDSSVKLHQLVQILRIQHSAAQSSMSHVITVGETDRGISTEAYHAW